MFITLAKKRADGEWTVLKGPETSLGAQKAYLTSIGISDPTYLQARIYQLANWVKRVDYLTDLPVTITAGGVQVKYGSVKPSGQFSATWSREVPNHMFTGSITYTCAYSKGAPPGTYEITPSGVTALDGVVFTFVKGILTVTKAELTLTVANAQMVEGEAAPAFSFTGTGFVNDEDETDLSGSAVYTVKNALGETVADVTLAEPGTYSVHLSGITSENYEITLVAGTLTITEQGEV